MSRTQVLLEPRQYYFVRDEARRRNMSLSALIRELISAQIEATCPESVEDDPFWEIIGMGDYEPDVARNHDKYIYRLDWRELSRD